MSRIVESLERLCEDITTVSNLPPEIEAFLDIDDNTEYTDQYRIVKAAGDIFFKELQDIKSKENDWDYLDDIYGMKRNFYKKYIDFVKKCKEMSSIKGITGYGKSDPIRIKIMQLCRAVDYNFPYGWKK